MIEKFTAVKISKAPEARAKVYQNTVKDVGSAFGSMFEEIVDVVFYDGRMFIRTGDSIGSRFFATVRPLVHPAKGLGCIHRCQKC
jgi:hypothetical protein